MTDGRVAVRPSEGADLFFRIEARCGWRSACSDEVKFSAEDLLFRFPGDVGTSRRLSVVEGEAPVQICAAVLCFATVARVTNPRMRRSRQSPLTGDQCFQHWAPLRQSDMRAPHKSKSAADDPVTELTIGRHLCNGDERARRSTLCRLYGSPIRAHRPANSANAARPRQRGRSARSSARLSERGPCAMEDGEDGRWRGWRMAF